MSRDVWLQQIRQAGTDPAAIERILADDIPQDALQHAGQAILRCSDSAALANAASRLIEALGRRGWVGDRELIDELERLASAVPSTLTALTVELDELGEALDQSVASVAYLDLDLDTATVWPAELLEIGEEPEGFDPDDEQRWLPVVGQGPRAGYTTMEDFITTVSDPRLAGRLHDAIARTGAFRRFRDELSRNDDEYTRWHRWRDDRRLGRARAWLAEQGYRSTR
jgi:hypothetical protein